MIASDSCFWQTGEKPHVEFCCGSLSTSKFDALFLPRSFLSHHGGCPLTSHINKVFPLTGSQKISSFWNILTTAMSTNKHAMVKVNSNMLLSDFWQKGNCIYLNMSQASTMVRARVRKWCHRAPEVAHTWFWKVYTPLLYQQVIRIASSLNHWVLYAFIILPESTVPWVLQVYFSQL